MQASKNQSISDNVSGNFSVIIKEKKRLFLITKREDVNPYFFLDCHLIFHEGYKVEGKKANKLSLLMMPKKHQIFFHRSWVFLGCFTLYSSLL